MSTTPTFTPVPVRLRRDGWTPARQTAFIAGLAQDRCIAAGCRAVGMSWQSAYRLRDRSDAASFAAAWDAALAHRPLPAGYSGRAIDGIARAITYRGRQVGERRHFDNRLAQYLLRVRAPDRYGRKADERPAAKPDLAEALAILHAELAAGRAPCAREDSSADVAGGSSPSDRVNPPRRSAP